MKLKTKVKTSPKVKTQTASYKSKVKTNPKTKKS